MPTAVVVVGAGVAGLTTAYLLIQNLPSANITIVAKHFPGDYDIEYASPWAGANYAPVSIQGSREADFDSKTWPALHKLALDTPEAGVHFQENVVYNREKDAQSATAQWFSGLLSSKPWFSDVVPDFRQLEKEELPEGISSGISYTSVCINTPQYLHYLLGKCTAAGVVVKRSILHDISDARTLHSSGQAASIVVNCTGLGAATLMGVQDTAVSPARGHIVLLRNDTAGRITFVSGTDDGPEETTYIMQRPGGGGTVVGGCYQAGRMEADPDPAMGERILERAVKLVPSLANGRGRAGLDVIRQGVGLRPVRIGGYRVEREQKHGWTIVHNYGHGVTSKSSPLLFCVIFTFDQESSSLYEWNLCETMTDPIADFITFLKALPTPYHAVKDISLRLLARGFEQLDERSDWASKCVAGRRYFVIRKSSTIAAFAIGYLWNPGDPVSIIVARTDSPCLRVKPNGKETSSGKQRMAVEPYGAGIWSSWFDRDLGLAGRALIGSQTNLEERLFVIPGAVCRIPSLASSTTGSPITVPIDEQAHLKPIGGLVSSTRGATIELQLQPGPILSLQKRQLIELVATNLGVEASQVCGIEAMLYDTQSAGIGGMANELVSAQRLDNLCMSYCALIGLLESLDDEPSFTTGSSVRMISFFDHGEIGSVSQNGARSNFLSSVLRRISRLSVAECQPPTSSPYEQMMAHSFLMSADMTHGLHPNLRGESDESSVPLLNGGLVTKMDANMKYATTASGIVFLRTIADHASVPLQMLVGNNDAACGSAIGSPLAAQLGVRGVNVGLAQWSMHSIRGTAGVKDVAYAIRLFRNFFTRFPGC
ncbi:hypothetical protein MBLNU459_g2814t1 [Dothideomycetes sp. NU459]